MTAIESRLSDMVRTLRSAKLEPAVIRLTPKLARSVGESLCGVAVDFTATGNHVMCADGQRYEVN